MNENKKEKLMSAVKKVREEELVSVITVACFAVYNLVLGLIRNYHFATSIGIYYLLVALTRVSILSSFKIEIERYGEKLTVKENSKLKRNGIIFFVPFARSEYRGSRSYNSDDTAGAYV
ncbi:MAG: hypothetical protein HP008_01865 [Clostridia bacterium]|nr:hypothetical protein [Clostridia bacterium]